MSDQAIAERKVNHQVADPISGHRGLTPSNAAEAMELAKMMAASSSAVPKFLRGQPGACLGVIDDALRMGVSPYALARKAYFVNDVLAYEAQVIMALVNASRIFKERPDIRFEGEGQDRRAIVTGQFRDGAVRELRSPRIADISPKNSPLWKSDPDQQLSYYSLRAFARRHAPEVVLGIVDIDELRDAAMLDITPKAETGRSIPQSLDEFAAQSAAAADVVDSEIGSPDLSTAEGSGGPQVGQPAPQTPPSKEAAAAADSADSADEYNQEYDRPAEMKAHCISVLLKLATNVSLPVERRLKDLDDEEVGDAFPDLTVDFVHQVATTAKKVAKGDLPAAKAKAYLEAL